ncbi:MAG: sigma-70 family RNA polymerase sigma factor [Bacteroidota bacterium]
MSSHIQFELAIRKGGFSGERAINLLFSNWSYLVERHHRRYRTLLSREDVSDIFTDAFLVYVKLVKLGKFESRHDKSAVGFIQQTMRFRVIDRMRKLTNQPYLEDITNLENVWYQPMKEMLDWELVDHCMDTLPERGKKILNLWMDGYHMDEIADKVGLANANSVAVTKCHTLKKVVKMYNQVKGKELQLQYNWVA